MTVRLTLLAPAPGPALRQARIDADGPLDEAGRRAARAAAPGLPAAGRHLSAPSRRCRETAEALGLDAATETALRDLDLGSWRGRALDELATAEPAALAAWTTDPSAAPHGGESVLDLCRRVSHWLDRLPDDAGRILAVTDASVARAAVLHALSAPPHAFWRIDVPPLGRVLLTGRADRWNLRME
ncbi:histidine phosphatase family protein [Streptomyces sp. MUM 136J]|uniref:histidine phosphatase family protein n=2 Tax=unclassified Streptomyces TaxID=2593676 RepID=UPI001F0476E0|nr:histidine phosphatase family protein [Streptomyces sp. MUM 136J]MCH0568257.1 histidine phosphatase family protein [Streptomyces sp. MUM 136J]